MYLRVEQWRNDPTAGTAAAPAPAQHLCHVCSSSSPRVGLEVCRAGFRHSLPELLLPLKEAISVSLLSLCPQPRWFPEEVCRVSDGHGKGYGWGEKAKIQPCYQQPLPAPQPLSEAGHPPQANVFQTGRKALATGMSTQ